jgi:hypothetical protein
MPTEPVQFPLIHPPYIARDVAADTFSDKYIFRPNLVRSFLDKTARIYTDHLAGRHRPRTPK